MKQLILIERSELDALRQGGTLSLTLNGGQTVTIGLEAARAAAQDGRTLANQNRRIVTPKTAAKIKALTGKGLSTREIARRVGISPHSAYMYASGRRTAPAGLSRARVMTPKMIRRIRHLRDVRHLSYKAIEKRVGISEKTARIWYHRSEK